jgi:hypothetical protein
MQDVVRKHNMLEQSCSTILESLLVGDTNTESFGSVKPGPSYVNSNGFFIFSAEDASSTIDFSKAPIDEGVVDSPPSNDNKENVVCFTSLLKNSKWNGICKASPERYRRSRQSWQFFGPPHVASTMEMTNATENSPCFLQPSSEVQLQASCKNDSTTMENIGASRDPNRSSNRMSETKGL